jgi:adenosine deaminase
MSAEIIAALPKVELHVHLEGSTRPETLLRLAERNKIALPASNIEGLKEWFKFRDFPHFVEIYVAASNAIRKPEDIELLAEEFARGQAEQNILYTEATYTATTILKLSGIPWNEQFDALQRGFAKVPETKVNLVLDIVRQFSVEEGEQIAQWCIGGFGKGVCAIGLSGYELQYPVSAHSQSFAEAKKAGLKITSHAGETQGAESIWEVLRDSYADRIGHGVRCLEDPKLVVELRDKQIHLEVNPSSNVCLGVVPNLAAHPFARLLDEGLSVSINSDDPPFFNTTLTEEQIRCSAEFDLTTDMIYSLTLGAVNAAFLPEEEKTELRRRIILESAEIL